MPWSETTPTDGRLQFVADVRRETDELTVLCRRYGISRKTGYEWLAPYDMVSARSMRRPSKMPPLSSTCETRR